MLAFGLFFFAINYPWFSIAPALVILFFTVNSFSSIKPWQFNFREFLETNSLYLSWILILLGISWLFFFLNVDVLYIAIYMMAINSLLWIWSFLTDYKDGKSLFHVMYYISFISFIAAVWNVFDTSILIKVLWYWLPFHLFMYVFVGFFIWSFVKVERRVWWLAYAYGHLTIMRIAAYIIKDIKLIHLVLGQLYLAFIYFTTDKILYLQEPIKKRYKPIDAKDILAWQKVLEYRRINKTKPKGSGFMVTHVQPFLQEMDPRIALLINSYNVALIAIIIAYYMFSFKEWTPVLTDQILYGSSMILFFINFIITQKEFTLPKRQRIFVFLIINFAIYSNIIFLSNAQPVTITTLGVSRNIINSLLILYSKYFIPENLVKTHDYWYRITVNLLVVPVNLFFMAQIDISGSLLFALISTYLWVQWFLLFYNVKYIKEEKSTA